MILAVVVSTALLTACGSPGSASNSRAAAEASSLWSATASAPTVQSTEATPSPVDETGISPATADKSGIESWNERAPAYEAETATLTLHVGGRELGEQRLANGGELNDRDDLALPLYACIFCAFGCRTDGPRLWFNLPSADGPLAFTAPTTDVPGALSWQIMLSKGNWPGEGFESAYPNQVVFTGIQSDGRFGDTTFTERGFTVNRGVV